MIQLLAAIVWETHFQQAIEVGLIPSWWDSDWRGRWDYATLFYLGKED